MGTFFWDTVQKQQSLGLHSPWLCVCPRISVFIFIHYVVESVSSAINLSNVLAVNTLGNSKLKKVRHSCTIFKFYNNNNSGLFRVAAEVGLIQWILQWIVYGKIYPRFMSNVWDSSLYEVYNSDHTDSSREHRDL